MKIPALQVAQSYSAARTALGVNNQNQSVNAAQNSDDGQNMAMRTVDEFAKTVAKGEQAAKTFMTTGADPHSVVEAIAAAELAVETAVTVRDKVVEAYQELIRMPI